MPGSAEREDHRQHLEFIQTAIGRMFTAASLVKGWCLTIATAALGFALTKDSRSVALLGTFAIALFVFLDARYLREERKFRALYEDARLDRVDVYDMRTNRYIDKGGSAHTQYCEWRRVVSSWSLWGFYGPIMLAGLAVVGYTFVK